MDSAQQSGGCLCKKITYKFDKSHVMHITVTVQIVKKARVVEKQQYC